MESLDAKNTSRIKVLRSQVLSPVADRYPGREELVEIIGLAFCSRDNVLVVGPPGTAKSELIAEISSRVRARHFEYLLTRFTEPSEVFGPIDLAELREGRVKTRTDGMLPEAEIAFLDEVFHAGSAILNTLLDLLNGADFRRGREVIPSRLISILAATNTIPDDPELRALQDRFTLRVDVRPLPNHKLSDLLRAGWDKEKERLAGSRSGESSPLSTDDLRELHRAVSEVDLNPVLPALKSLIERVRALGLFLSDRRAVKLQKLIAASAVLSNRRRARVSDLWPARYLWDADADCEGIEEIVDGTIGEYLDADNYERDERDHPLAFRGRQAHDILDAAKRLESEIDGLPESATTDVSDRLHDRIHHLDRELRWCRLRAPLDEVRLRELETKLSDLAGTLAEKTEG